MNGGGGWGLGTYTPIGHRAYDRKQAAHTHTHVHTQAIVKKKHSPLSFTRQSWAGGARDVLVLAQRHPARQLPAPESCREGA